MTRPSDSPTPVPTTQTAFAVGQAVRVTWTRQHFTENGIVAEVYPSHPNIVSVRFRDGLVQYVSVGQLALLDEVPA